jgi:hypothetical protein
MTRLFWSAAPIALGLLLATTDMANAARVPSVRVVTYPSTGAHHDITVPYTTNGRSTLGVYQGIGPQIVSQPGLSIVDDAQVRPVYNLPFYGGKQSFDSGKFGSIDRRANSLRPGR